MCLGQQRTVGGLCPIGERKTSMMILSQRAGDEEMSVNLLQQLMSIPNPGGTGIPVTQYANTLQQVLTTQLESVPNQEISKLNSTQTALSSLQTAVQNFQNATNTLAGFQTWNQVTATSSNPTAFSVTASAGAQPGSYSILVNSLANNQINVAKSGQQASDSAAANLSGSFTITGGGQTTPVISVTTSMSLDQIAAAVNSYTAQTGVEATILNNGSSTPYQLVFQSTNTGSANSFTVADQSGSNLISTQLNIGTATQTATNASITLDGSVNLTSSTNKFTNAIPDTTITVAQTGGAGNVTLTQNTQAIVQSVQTWMSAYNSMVDILHSDTAYTPPSTGSTTGGKTGPLLGDPNASGLLDQLPAVLSTQFSSDTYQSLAVLGIVLDPTTGHLEFQPSGGFGSSGGTLTDGQTTFTNALQTNAGAVMQTFGTVAGSGASATATSGILGAVTTALGPFLGANGSTGTIKSDITGVQAQVANLNSYVGQLNQEIAQQVANFTSQLNKLNASLNQSNAQMQELASLIGGGSMMSRSSSSFP